MVIKLLFGTLASLRVLVCAVKTTPQTYLNSFFFLPHRLFNILLPVLKKNISSLSFSPHLTLNLREFSFSTSLWINGKRLSSFTEFWSEQPRVLQNKGTQKRKEGEAEFFFLFHLSSELVGGRRASCLLLSCQRCPWQRLVSPQRYSKTKAEVEDQDTHKTTDTHAQSHFLRSMTFTEK